MIVEAKGVVTLKDVDGDGKITYWVVDANSYKDYVVNVKELLKEMRTMRKMLEWLLVTSISWLLFDCLFYSSLMG